MKELLWAEIVSFEDKCRWHVFPMQKVESIDICFQIWGLKVKKKKKKSQKKKNWGELQKPEKSTKVQQQST